MSTIVRLAQLEDAEEILDVSLRAYKPIKDLNIKFIAATADLDIVQKNVRRNATYVLEKDSKIIGTVTVRYPWADPDHLSPYPFIWWFAIDPEYKRQGLGSILLEWVEKNILRDQVKAPAVYLATALRHPWLVSIYERRGYKIYEEKEYEGDKIVFLRKVLDEYLYNIIENKEPIVSK